MFNNRISRYYNDADPSHWDAAPEAAAAPIAAVGMVLVPLAMLPSNWQAQLYQLAHRRAVEDVERVRRFFSSCS